VLAMAAGISTALLLRRETAGKVVFEAA